MCECCGGGPVPTLHPKDVVGHKTPYHRAAHEAHEYRRAADVLGLLRERVIFEHESVDRW